MAGYSGTPLAKKLGIKPEAQLFILNGPPQVEQWLEPLPAGVTDAGKQAKPGSADIVLCFAASRAELARRFTGAMRALKTSGGLWIAWPKQAARKIDPRWATNGAAGSSRKRSSLTENDVRAFGLAAGLVDIKVCAISEVWSGLRFVHRLKDR